MTDAQSHNHVIRKRGAIAYRRELAPEMAVGSEEEEVLDMKLMKLVFVSMIAVVAYGLSWFVFAL